MLPAPTPKEPNPLLQPQGYGKGLGRTTKPISSIWREPRAQNPLSKPSKWDTGALTTIPVGSSWGPSLWQAGRLSLPLTHLSCSVLSMVQMGLGSLRRWG